MKQFLFDCGTRDPLASTGVLVLRASVGLMMLFGHGIPKWRNYGAIVENWTTVPAIWPLSHMTAPMSFMAAIGAEVFASALLVLGLMTRPAAFVLGFAMVVAAFQQHAADPFFSKGGPAKEMAVLYLVPCLVLIVTGAGLWSFDSPLSADKRKRRRH